MPALVALIISAVVTCLLAWGMLRWAPRLGLTDLPNERKPHERETPIGGLALILGSLAGFLLFAPLSLELLSWLAGALGVALLGLIDDRWELNAPIKLLGQALLTLFPVLGGGLIIYSIHLLGMTIHLGVLAGPFTFIWLLGITNAFNLIDGLDGLAAGAVVILAASLALLSGPAGNEAALLLSLALLGASLTFLFFNTHPARLFLGDGGSYYLGFTLALLTVAALQAKWGPMEDIPFLVPVVLMGYPIVDMLWAIVRRAHAGRSILKADREHLHHQWLKRGWGYRRTVWMLYGLFTALAALGLLLHFLF
ncbi:MAG: hypothetical protein A2Z21_01365 [Candidatus Fraserbacteria bacterium RBG_16_55_9]|uniref:Undecaprenyl-phosphate alpha-N-acetylglucosaminyl 1-phosphate transferase n=1 Tax=Fraserbacteria sp. (strain RBG_16_55_9) TaxID=1817864 RepID=A0A1F5URA8_FRAXR|nr:MAG: hypothetical protein A2Z21_01365 [Candidatus Fraserbacteria bacterium RBG_16_55_9]